MSDMELVSKGRHRGYTLGDVVGWMAAGPAKHIGVRGKGTIAVGRSADFAVFAHEDTQTVDAAALDHRNAVTPDHGRTLNGVVRATYLRGQRIGDQPFRHPHLRHLVSNLSVR